MQGVSDAAQFGVQKDVFFKKLWVKTLRKVASTRILSKEMIWGPHLSLHIINLSTE